MTLAPPLSPELLARLRGYRAPSARDIERMVAVRHARLRYERRMARLGLRAAAAVALGCSAGAMLSVTDQMRGLLCALVVLCVCVAPFLVSAARANGLKVQARRDVESDFGPLDARQSQQVLAFLHRHPEATQIIRSWRADIGQLRRYEFELFEDVFRAGNSTAHPQEVADYLELAGDGRPASGITRHAQGECS